MRRGSAVFLIGALALAVAGGIAAPRQVAAETQTVNVWAELDSQRPAVGCEVGVGVEVRAGGNAVSSTEVSIHLFVDDEVVSGDSAVTDGDGIAYLAFDTSGAYAGADGWLDVNVAGGYVGGFSILPSSDGGCADGGDAFSVTADVPAITAASVVGESGSGSGGVFIGGVPTYVQQRNLSCEYASLYIATAAFGNGVSEYTFEEIVGWSDNPHWGYRGDITGWWGNTDDYGVYAEALVPALDAFGFYGEVFYGLGDPAALIDRIDRGMPTLVWIGLWGDTAFNDYAVDGTRFKLAAGMHVVVVYGYDDGGVYVSDPALGDTRYLSWGDFLYQWNVLDGMSLAIAPY